MPIWVIYKSLFKFSFKVNFLMHFGIRCVKLTSLSSPQQSCRFGFEGGQQPVAVEPACGTQAIADKFDNI